MDRAEEVEIKRERIRRWLSSNFYTGVLLTSTANFSWYTAGGDNHVAIASESGVAPILVTSDRDYIITNNIEAQRIRAEELGGLDIEVVAYEWQSDHNLDRLVGQLSGGGLVVTDSDDHAQAVSELRFSLTPPEIDRYRSLGQDVGEALAEACNTVQPGQTEFEAVGLVANNCLARGVTPTLLLAAADGRIGQHRHPIPTDARIRDQIMLVVCGRRHGLIVSTTRLVSFAPISEVLRRRHLATCTVDAVVNHATTEGAVVSGIFGQLQRAYSDQGFGPEWRLHHQGGATGYGARDYKATPNSEEIVQPWQAFAWNPSITGTKSEDTIISTPDGPEFLTVVENWPTVEVSTGKEKIHRPDISFRNI